MAWRLGRDDRSWARLLRARTSKDGNLRGGNSLNRTVVQCGSYVYWMGEMWIIREVEKTDFWPHDWLGLGLGPLRNKIYGPMPARELDRSVAYVLTNEGEWD